MEKLDIKITLPEEIEFIFQKQYVKMIPFISLVSKNNLVNTYIENLFKTEGDYVDNLLSAELMFCIQLTDSLTSIKLGENGVDVETLIDSGLWREIQKNISNYYDVREEIEFAVANILEQRRLEKSLGSVLESLSSKAFAFLDKLSELNISEENLSKLVGEFKTEYGKFSEKYGGVDPSPRKRTKKAE